MLIRIAPSSIATMIVLASAGALYGADAIQTIYRDGVPHTDKKGIRLFKYDPERSLFPIGSWGTPQSREYRGVDYDWKHLVEAGYNTVWPWPMGGYSSEDQLAQAAKYGMQVILMRKHDEEKIRKLKDHPNLLGIVWQDEPLINFGIDKQEKPLEEFRQYRDMVRRVAPDLLCFVNTSPWMVDEGRPWYIAWHEAGNISCHENGVADSVSLAVEVTQEKKPLWLITQAFESPDPPSVQFPFRFPTPMQLRAMVYCGLIHGATGITHYAWDSNITRVGISPNGRHDIPGRPNATPIQALMARTLWDTTAIINRELKQLVPAIYSPTAGADFKYSVNIEGNGITETPIRGLLKKHPDGGYVLLTVNMDDAVMKATWTFPKRLRHVVPLFENREPLQLRSGQKEIVAEYEPFDVHVFRIKLAE
jgi:hypothetical protein